MIKKIVLLVSLDTPSLLLRSVVQVLICIATRRGGRRILALSACWSDGFCYIQNEFLSLRKEEALEFQQIKLEKASSISYYADLLNYSVTWLAGNLFCTPGRLSNWSQMTGQYKYWLFKRLEYCRNLLPLTLCIRYSNFGILFQGKL